MPSIDTLINKIISYFFCHCGIDSAYLILFCTFLSPLSLFLVPLNYKIN